MTTTTNRILAILALVACVPTAFPQTPLFQDDFSDPKLSGWTQLGVPGVLSSSNQQALISANCGPLQTNNPFATHFAWGHAIPMPPELTNNWTLEGRLDLVRVNQNDTWASVHFLWSPLGNSGYAFLVDRDEAALMKFWNGGGSMAWFFYEPREIKNQNVTLVLSVTRRDANLVINTRVVDKDNANAVVFDRTVIDTPQADPTLPSRSVKGTPSVNDMVGEPWRMVSGPGQIEVTLDWTNPTSGPTGPAQIVYDNVEVWLYESPRPNVVAWEGLSYGSATVPSSLTNAVAVAAGGATSLALRSDGTVALWGGILDGTLGELWRASAATFPSDLSNVVAIAAGSTAMDISPLGCHFLALRADGTVIRWDSSSLPPKTDVPPGLTHVVAVAPGAGHCLALGADGSVVAWGENWDGQTNVPSGLTNAVAVAAGWSHSLALRADGTVLAWGNPAQTNLPAGLSGVVAVAAGFAHSLALCADGRIVAWGGSGSWHPEYGGTNVPPSLTNAVAVAAGLYQGLAVRVDGTVVAWPTDMPATGVPSGLDNVVAIAGGVYQGVALIADGPPALHAPLHHPRMTAEGFSVSVSTQSGRVYRLEYKNSLAEPAWTPLPLVAGAGHERTLTDPTATGAQRFYRVRRW
jgi:hypothetical protein